MLEKCLHQRFVMYLRQYGYNGLRQTSSEVGKDGERSENIEFLRMPSGKRRVHSVSGRHTEFIRRFPEGVRRFYHLRSLPSYHGNCQNTYQHRTRFFEVH